MGVSEVGKILYTTDGRTILPGQKDICELGLGLGGGGTSKGGIDQEKLDDYFFIILPNSLFPCALAIGVRACGRVWIVGIAFWKVQSKSSLALLPTAHFCNAG